jgi:hypothetical protein
MKGKNYGKRRGAFCIPLMSLSDIGQVTSGIKAGKYFLGIGFMPLPNNVLRAPFLKERLLL